MTRYSPSRQYLWSGAIALLLAAASAWFAPTWSFAVIPAALLAVSAILVLTLALQPEIEVHDTHLSLGRRVISWNEIRRVDRTGWISPLAVRLTLADRSRVLLIHPGDLESATRLLRQLRRHATEALIDGVPYRQFWGEPARAAQRGALVSPRYPVLRADDEAEVERLYQRLKTVGHIDPRNAPDEK